MQTQNSNKLTSNCSIELRECERELHDYRNLADNYRRQAEELRENNSILHGKLVIIDEESGKVRFDKDRYLRELEELCDIVKKQEQMMKSNEVRERELCEEMAKMGKENDRVRENMIEVQARENDSKIRVSNCEISLSEAKEEMKQIEDLLKWKHDELKLTKEKYDKRIAEKESDLMQIRQQL